MNAAERAVLVEFRSTCNCPGDREKKMAQAIVALRASLAAKDSVIALLNTRLPDERPFGLKYYSAGTAPDVFDRGESDELPASAYRGILAGYELAPPDYVRSDTLPTPDEGDEVGAVAPV